MCWDTEKYIIILFYVFIDSCLDLHIICSQYATGEAIHLSRQIFQRGGDTFPLNYPMSLYQQFGSSQRKDLGLPVQVMFTPWVLCISHMLHLCSFPYLSSDLISSSNKVPRQYWPQIPCQQVTDQQVAYQILANSVFCPGLDMHQCKAFLPYSWRPAFKMWTGLVQRQRGEKETGATGWLMLW